MGMFDYFYSSYDIGEQFTNISCQTKDLDETGDYGSMSQFWLSPGKQLYVMTYKNTFTMEKIEEHSPEYDKKLSFLNYKWVATGKRGRVVPCKTTAYVEIYPERYIKETGALPRLKLHLRDGKLLEYFECNPREVT